MTNNDTVNNNEQIYRLQKALDAFYKMHQISKKNNILLMYLNDKTESYSALRCVCDYFNIDGHEWPKQTNAQDKKSKCYYARNALSDSFGEEFQCNESCKSCYKFCINKYIQGGGEIKLKKRTKRY